MKISKLLLLPVYLCLLSAVHASDSTLTPGKLIMTGEIIEATCSVDPASRNIEVSFGDVPASAIVRNDQAYVTRAFDIHLIGCSLVSQENSVSQYPYATITFIGNAAVSEPDALLPSGKASGFGIVLRDRNGEILALGKPSAGYQLSDEDNVLKFTASLVPVAKEIRAGEFYATAQFFMDYN